MIIQLSSGQHELLERDDYQRLKLRVPSGWTATDIERGLPFSATCTPEHIWMKESDLRALAMADTITPDPITAMLDKARKYGFYDEANGTVRVHIEYY